MVKMPESQEKARELMGSPEHLTPSSLGRMIGAEDLRGNQKTSTPSFGTFSGLLESSWGLIGLDEFQWSLILSGESQQDCSGGNQFAAFTRQGREVLSLLGLSMIRTA